MSKERKRSKEQNQELKKLIYSFAGILGLILTGITALLTTAGVLKNDWNFLEAAGLTGLIIGGLFAFGIIFYLVIIHRWFVAFVLSAITIVVLSTGIGLLYQYVL